MKASTAYSQYIPARERPVLTTLIKKLITRGYSLAVHDGEEYVTPRTKKLTTVRPALGGTGEDSLIVFEDGQRIGSFYLIYNNGSQCDPMTVIADFSGWDDDVFNEFEEIWEEIFKKYG